MNTLACIAASPTSPARFNNLSGKGHYFYVYACFLQYIAYSV